MRILELPTDAGHVQESNSLFFEVLPGHIGPYSRRDFYETTFYDRYIGIRQKWQFIPDARRIPMPMAHHPEIQIHLTELSPQRTIARITSDTSAAIDFADELIRFWRELYGLAQPAETSGGEAHSLQRQLVDARESLRVIDERKAQYVQEVDIPLQLIKDERRLKEQITEIKKKLAGSGLSEEHT
jgi:hypothetical protein